MKTVTPSSPTQVKPIPAGMHTVTPHLVCAGAAEAVEFYKKAFGATDVCQMPGPGGKLMHAHLKIGDSSVMMMDEFPEWGAIGPKTLKGSPVTIHLYVPDVDASYERAVKGGAKSMCAPQDMFWGDRYSVVVDPFGHHWAIASRVREVSPEEAVKAMQQQHCPGDPVKA
jgi:PhnB protein